MQKSSCSFEFKLIILIVDINDHNSYKKPVWAAFETTVTWINMSCQCW